MCVCMRVCVCVCVCRFVCAWVRARVCKNTRPMFVMHDLNLESECYLGSSPSCPSAPRP
jgi:hypothetical protein